MKKVSLLTLICFIFLTGCTDRGTTPSSTKITRIIKNESDYPVLIKSYFNQPDPPLDTVAEINLNTGESHSATGFYVSGPLTSSRVEEGLIETLVSVDSVVVVFDNEKYQVHCLVLNPNCNVDKLDRKIILSDPSTNDLEHLGYDLEKNGGK